MFRTLKFIFLLGACFGVPYSYYNLDWQQAYDQVVNKSQGFFSTTTTSSPGSDSVVPTFVPSDQQTATTANSTLPASSNQAVANYPASFHSLPEALNFSATPRWIMSRWPRVTTTLADLNLEGIRVPLVTGTGMHDLAGSLTYYFDRNQQVQRITFLGHTGDDRALVQMLMAKPYSFKPEPSLGAGLYMIKWNGKPTSVLKISHAPVVQANSPHARLQVELEINRPTDYYALSPHMQQVITQDQRALRWGEP